MRVLRTNAVCMLVIAGLALPACRTERDASTAAHDVVAGIPSSPPSVTGTVTEIGSDGRIRIEENPSEPSGSQKFVVRLSDGATILTRGGVAMKAGDIAVGSRVSAWLVGPVMESYPAQGTANVIVIESARR